MRDCSSLMDHLTIVTVIIIKTCKNDVNIKEVTLHFHSFAHSALNNRMDSALLCKAALNADDTNMFYIFIGRLSTSDSPATLEVAEG